MPTEALSCPTCNAHDSSRPDASGIHTCVYCGVRYRITGGGPRTIAATPTSARSGTGPVVLGAAVAIGILAVALIAALGRSSGPSTPSTAAPRAIAAPDVAIAVAPAGEGITAAPVSPTVSVEAPVPVVVAPEPPAAAHFELTHRRPSSGSTFYAVGYVTNDSPYPIDRPKVTAVMKDAAGTEVGTDFGYADEVLDANASEAMEILVMNPPVFATIEFEVVPRKATYIPAEVEGLRLEAGAATPAPFGKGHGVQGKVIHGGTVPARFIHVRAVAFDAANKLIGVDYTYADAEVLQPGATARFNLSIRDLGAEIGRWDFSVRARAAD